MTYKEANNIIDDISWVYKGTYITEQMRNECREVCHEALEEQEKHRWIPVSERLPENESDKYLCCNSNGYIQIYGFSKDLFRLDVYDFIKFKDKAKAGFYDYDSEWGYRYCDEVVAWMQLPEPYNERVDSN